MGFVDLHVHLLPSIDDGPRTLDESLELARGLVFLGFSGAAPSPHNRVEYVSNSRDLRLYKLEELREYLAKHSVALELHVNAENAFIDDSFIAWAEGDDDALSCIGESDYVLIETPFSQPFPKLTQAIARMQSRGLVPLLAHPERCAVLQDEERLGEALEAGAELQLDLGALIGIYGTVAKKWALDILERKLYSVAATDLHHPRGVKTYGLASIEALREAVGEAEQKRLLSDKPREILSRRRPRTVAPR